VEITKFIHLQVQATFTVSVLVIHGGSTTVDYLVVAGGRRWWWWPSELLDQLRSRRTSFSSRFPIVGSGGARGNSPGDQVNLTIHLAGGGGRYICSGLVVQVVVEI
jgi:hypothetical protein